MDRLAGAVGVPDGREERELLLEQVLVVLERVAEERERLGERAAAEDHLGAAVGEGVQGGEALVDADGVVGAQHRHRGAQADPGGAGGDGGQEDFETAHRDAEGFVEELSSHGILLLSDRPLPESAADPTEAA